MSKKFVLRGRTPSEGHRQLAATPARADPLVEAISSKELLPALLTTAAVARQLGVAARTLDRWRLTGEGPEFVKLSSQTVRYSPDAVAAFIARRTKANTSC